MFIEALEKTDDEILSMIQLCKARARNQGTKVIKLFPKRLKFGIVVSNKEVTLLEGINFFLELSNPKEISLCESFSEVSPNVNGYLKEDYTLSNGRCKRVEKPRHQKSVAAFPVRVKRVCF